MAENLSTLSSTGTEGTPTGLGQRYVSISVWESAAQGNHGAGDDTVLECYKGTTVENGFDGSGSEVSFQSNHSWLDNIVAADNIVIEAADGEGHDGVLVGSTGFWPIGAGFGIWYNGSIAMIELDEDYVTFENFTLEHRNPANATGRCIYSVNDQTGNVFDRMVLTANGSYNSSQSTFYPRGSAVIDNCIVMGGGREAVLLVTGPMTVSNCLFLTDGATRAIASSSLLMDLINCAAFANGGIGYVNSNGWAAGSTNNASDDATAPGPNPQNNCVIADAFNNYAGYDYTPVVDGPLDSTGSAVVLPLNDITGYPHNNPPEIGPYAIPGGVVGAVLTLPTDTNEAQTTATIGCTTDTDGGTLYWYVTTSATPPSAADLKAGTGAVDSGSLTPTSGINEVGATGLTPSTTYYHYWIQET